MIKSIKSIQTSIEALRETGLQRGDLTGFACLDELYSVKQGSFTIVQGPPGHGKSEFIFELLLTQAKKYGKKSVVLSPESGSAEEIAMELIHKYLRQTAYKTNNFTCEDRKFYEALNWVDYNFVIADDDDQSYSFDDLILQVEKYEKEFDVEFDLVMAEPWNELNHKLALAANGGRQDLAIEDELTQVRRYCAGKGGKKKKHMFLSFHPSHQSLVRDTQTGLSYYEMPKAREAAGGQATLRKAMSWINMWRAPEGMIDMDTNTPYPDNVVVIQIEKSKPKGIGKKGICKLYWDWAKNAYYEIIDNEKRYALDHEFNFKNVNTKFDTAIQPNSLF